MLAYLFLLYAFDTWMARTFPAVPFECYADDGVVHCVSESQAQYVCRAIGNRMAQVGLRLHPDKTKIVYGKLGTGAAVTSTPRSRSSGTRSEPAQHGIVAGACSPRSCPRSARKP
ncbi:hypothetical protein Acsp02_97480 [Actinoplanes sp. NBRC 103695]|nr:hypothetical protein Acsp02_97480 [Actinoplanes sp. NBRC 103695]